MFKKIKILFIFLFLLSAFLTFPKQTHAIGSYTNIPFCNNNDGTWWDVKATYRSVSGRSFSFTVTRANSADVSNPSSDWCDTNGFANVMEYEIQNYAGQNGDSLHWLTACVDPTSSVTIVAHVEGSGENLYKTNAIDVTCRSDKTGTTIYRGCGNPKNHGEVKASAVCPGNDSNDCVKAGLVDYCSDGSSSCNSNCKKTSYNCNYSFSGSSMCRTSTDNNNRSCVNNGSCDCITNNDCSNNKTCVSNNCVSRYSCQNDGQCVRRVNGDYPAGDCNDKCGPVDECQNNADCNNDKVCGNGADSCKRYDTVCQTVGEGARRHKACVKNNIINQNSAACGAGCPVGPDGLTDSTSCDANSTASITFNWDHIPYEQNYDLYFKTATSGRYSRIGKIDPVGTGKNTVTKNGLAFNTNYDWYVIGHTTAGHDDPTKRSVIKRIRTTTKSACLGSITVTAYNDYDGDGFKDPTDTAAKNIKFTVNGNVDTDYKTGNNGKVTLANLQSDDYTIDITGLPGGWTTTTTDPVTRHILPPASQTVNFGIQPPAPTCSGGLVANPTSVIPGGTSNLRATGCTTATGATPTYEWPVPDIGTTVDVNNPNTTWSVPGSYTAINTSSHPSVTICNPGTTVVCRSYGATIAITPRFSIAGRVYIDTDKDGYSNNGEDPYTDSRTRINLFNGTATTGTPRATRTNTTGLFSFGNLPPGTYTVVYTNKPQAYTMTFPTGAGNSKFTVVIGTGQCNNNNDGRNPEEFVCTAGSISKVNFGMNNANPWIQTGGSDVWFNSGINNPIPGGSTCNGKGAFMSIKINNTPGIIFSGPNNASFGGGAASTNPYNWQVGGLSYPEPYAPVTPGIIRTSYDYISALAVKNGFGTFTNLTSLNGCDDLNDCQLPTNTVNFPNGVYSANGDVHLTRANYTFPANKNFVILVKGDLYIEGEIHVPEGSTVLFTVGKRNNGSGGNIHVDTSVGTLTIDDYDNMHVEGWYSADDSFIVDGLGGDTGSACPLIDRRLNVAGAIVTNAALEGGGFVNQRDMCGGDATCPVFYIRERADFILNAPAFLQVAPRIWQEVAP